ncbi:hypothetical protein ColKHC_01800 [Colletotrichum higginsianum]|uniref:Uncharacterized protein n=1 Tax=Colletotrichum higginsianum TaxID=80884 RepID=A0A4V4NCG6_9PEZI|nr:hypothetical protein CH35J_006471 [Colletotrichum higginsianum]GJC92974.1 hypothetical protein ColKHC_01800 [Colletotrichum higginsianum]
MYSGSHRRHEHGRKSDKRDSQKDHKIISTAGSAKPEKSSSTSSSSSSPPPLSFLFVVNELDVIDEGHGRGPFVDRFGSPLPPEGIECYGDETVGAVWRYQNGTVTAAPEYFWNRPRRGSPGDIATFHHAFDDMGQPVSYYHPMVTYSTHSVFNCWRFLPCIWTSTDISTVATMDFNIDHKWSPLGFRHDPHEPGRTRILGPERSVADRDPSWVPHLLPSTYAAPQSAPPSRGLGGPFGIVIGLLGLARRPGHADDAFRDGLWSHGRLAGSRSGRAGERESPFGQQALCRWLTSRLNQNLTQKVLREGSWSASAMTVTTCPDRRMMPFFPLNREA